MKTFSISYTTGSKGSNSITLNAYNQQEAIDLAKCGHKNFKLISIIII